MKSAETSHADADADANADAATSRLLLAMSLFGCADMDAEVTEGSVDEVSVEEVSTQSLAVESNEGKVCRSSRDCRGGSSTFCCHRRCTQPFPGMRCLSNGGGFSDE